MKRLWIGILATLLVIVGVVPAFAWEFTLEGQYEWRFRYLGRVNGSQDLFGDMRFQDSPLNTTNTTIGFAGLNMWRGYNGGTVDNPIPMQTGFGGSNLRIVRSGLSFADGDASLYDMRMTFKPVLNINKAVYFISNVDLAGMQHKYNHRDVQTNGPLNRWYMDRSSQNAFDTGQLASFNQWKLGLRLPWGTASLGNKDFMVGTGAQWGYNSRGSALVFLIPYGPFVITPQFWMERKPDGYGSFTPYTGTGPGMGTVVNMDPGEHPQVFWSPLLDYYNGPLHLGVGMVQNLFHYTQSSIIQGQLQSGLPGINVSYLGAPTHTGQRITLNNGVYTKWPNITAMDFTEIEWMVWGQYNNGRFFANAEYDWGERDFFYTGAPQVYNEYYLFFSEAGVMCGPAKLSFMFSSSGGPALNNNNPTKNYQGNSINSITTDNYNYLLFHNYGGGNDAGWNTLINFTNDEVGQMNDAVALAARLDYAIAANLNIWGSYMWATREEKNSWLAGSKDADGQWIGGWTVQNAQAWKAAVMPGAGPASGMNPYVDDNFLGWEAGFGVNWKLLENTTVATRYAYWQPGPWFDQAYQVVGIKPGGAVGPTYNAAHANNHDGAFMQGRSPIQAFESSVLIDF
ncbi:MAG: hypothetical protein M0T73_02505 [Deltaproteobacteria bacterium]|nr:hypothetical protein [Deltaproteobacteria bacterium]